MENELKNKVVELLRECAKECEPYLSAYKQTNSKEADEIQNKITKLNTEIRVLEDTRIPRWKEILNDHYDEAISKQIKANCFKEHEQFLRSNRPTWTQVNQYYNDVCDDLARRINQPDGTKYKIAFFLDENQKSVEVAPLTASQYYEYQIPHYAMCKTSSIETAEHMAEKAFEEAVEAGIQFAETKATYNARKQELEDKKQELKVLQSQLNALNSKPMAREEVLKEKENRDKFMHPIEMMLAYNSEELNDFFNPNSNDPFQKQYTKSLIRGINAENRNPNKLLTFSKVSTRTVPYLIEDIIAGKVKLPEKAQGPEME